MTTGLVLATGFGTNPDAAAQANDPAQRPAAPLNSEFSARPKLDRIEVLLSALTDKNLGSLRRDKILQQLTSDPKSLLSKTNQIKTLLSHSNTTYRVNGLILVEALGADGAVFANEIMTILKAELPPAEAYAKKCNRLVDPINRRLGRTLVWPALKGYVDQQYKEGLPHVEAVEIALRTIDSFPNAKKLLLLAKSLSPNLNYQDRCDTLIDGHRK